MRPPLRIAILDDYLKVARDLADWESLPGPAQVDVFPQHIDDEDELVSQLEPFDVVCLMRERTAFPRRVIERLPRLQLIVTSGRANASIDVAAAAEQGVLVCGTEARYESTVELTWALILAAVRDIPRQDASTRSGTWQTSLGQGLYAKRLGVIGTGNVGAAVARIGVAFGMDVVGLDVLEERVRNAGATPVGKNELLGTSDVVTIHLRLTERTRGFIGAAELRRMKPNAFLVNTSRAQIVDQVALIRALRHGTIAGAALDVYDVEPLPPHHPLISAPHTVLSPHLGYSSRENMARLYAQMAEDIAGFQAGEPLRVIRPDFDEAPSRTAPVRETDGTRRPLPADQH